MPPVGYLRNTLQYGAAKDGFENRAVLEYVKALFRFVKPRVPKMYLKLLRPVKKMYKKKSSVSDEMISDVRRKGYARSAKIPQEVCSELAIKYCEKLEKQLPRLHKMLIRIQA